MADSDANGDTYDSIQILDADLAEHFVSDRKVQIKTRWTEKLKVVYLRDVIGNYSMLYH